MNDAWLDFAIRIQSIAQAGLQYGKDKYDIERYEELRRISAEMIAVRTDIPVAKVYDLFCYLLLGGRVLSNNSFGISLTKRLTGLY